MAAVLDAVERSSRGKNEARRLRAGGRIPAVFYGEKEAGKSIAVDPKGLARILRTEQQAPDQSTVRPVLKIFRDQCVPSFHQRSAAEVMIQLPREITPLLLVHRFLSASEISILLRFRTDRFLNQSIHQVVPCCRVTRSPVQGRNRDRTVACTAHN